jgi:hypothetical protein
VISAELLADLESCQRRGYYSRDFRPRRLHPTELTRRAIYAALSDPEAVDTGRRAGEAAIGLCADIGLDVKGAENIYDIGLHHAAIADIVSAWLKTHFQAFLAPPVDWAIGNHTWEASCLAQGKEGRLVRVVLVDHWGEDRLLAEARNWYTVGEVAVYDVPMDVHVIALGASRGGKRYSAWSKGLLHPRNRKVRFKKQANKAEGFKDSWIPVWREEHDQIDRRDWLKGMEDDDVIRDLTTKFSVQPLSPFRRMEALDTIRRKADVLAQLSKLPDPSYSACDWPRPCPFRSVCFAPVTTSPPQLGFRERH